MSLNSKCKIMSFLCYLCHLGPNRGFRFLPFWKTAIIFLSLNRYVWFIQGEMAKCGCAAPFCAACMGGSGVACAAVMHGCASFAQRLRAGLRPSRGGHARACVLLKAVAGGSAPTGATASEGTPACWVPAYGATVSGAPVTGAPTSGAPASGAPLSDLTCRRGTCVRAAAGHTGLSPCRPHPGLRHPGAPASGVRYKQCRRRPAKHAKRRRHKARRRGGQRGNSFHSCR